MISFSNFMQDLLVGISQKRRRLTKSFKRDIIILPYLGMLMPMLENVSLFRGVLEK